MVKLLVTYLPNQQMGIVMNTRFFASVFAASSFVLAATAAFAQDFPNRPIRISTSAAGGGNDFAARLIAQGLSANLPHPTVVDNRPTLASAQFVSKAPPDGYSVLLTGNSFWITPLLQSMQYAVSDFAPVVLLGTSPNIIAVPASLPVKSVKELIALAKAKPGELNFGSGAVGSTAHLGPEMLKAMAAINIVHVPYKGAGPAVLALVAGEIQLLLTSASAVTAQIKAGKLRALGVTSLQPSALVPGVPTVAASGLPGFEVISTDAIFAPSKTPPAIIARLNEEIGRVLNKPEVKDLFFKNAVEVVGGPPELLDARVKADMISFGKIIKDNNIRVQ
jgi:tripartite-type tricarboxylate transporter receptor subunit TctC